MPIIRRGVVPFLLLVAAALSWSPMRVAAHPADEYLQAAYLRLEPGRLAVQLDLTAGPLVAPDLIALADRDGNGQISAAEGRAYGEQAAHALELTIDGQPASLRLDAVSVPDRLLIEAGAGTIRLDLSAAAPTASGDHEVIYRNAHQPIKSVYQAHTLLPDANALTIDRLQRDATQQALTIGYRVVAETTPEVGTETPGADAPGVTALVAGLAGTGGRPWWALLGLAALLGGLHALTPGHGKTLAAAYLVGSRGTPGHAFLLGGTVTLTHTASVFGVGLLALLAGHSIASGALAAALELGAGLLALLLGARLLWRQGRAARRGAAERGHDHAHDHEHIHDHGDHAHHHPERAGLGGVIALGVSGGLTPCPEALGVMLVAISLGQAWQGLGLIAAFSVGLAATIIALGLALVQAGGRARALGLLDRAWMRLVPLGSAALIVVLGSIMTARGLLAALDVIG